MLLPNKRHKKIYEEKMLSLETDDPQKQQELVRKLISRAGEAARIEPGRFEGFKQSLMQVNRRLNEQLKAL